MNYGNNHITQELLTRLRNGDILAYDQIYNLYSHKLYHFVFKILKDDGDSEDTVQEVFIKIWELRNELKDYKLLNSFIFTLAYNSSITLIRKRISSAKYLENLKLASVNQSNDIPYVEAEFNELKLQIDRLIESLPDRQKQVFLSHREQGLTYSEIAHEMGISENTVENHMAKALKFLRLHLKGFLPIIRVMVTFLK